MLIRMGRRQFLRQAASLTRSRPPIPGFVDKTAAAFGTKFGPDPRPER